MPRRLIIGILILLIVGIVGGTIAIVLQRLQGPTTDTPVAEAPDTLTPADTGNQQLANPTADDDADGLTNAEELVWGTDSTNPDTDGDGYQDGEEVAANHNPTIAAPNDLLPANFQPGQNLQPLEEAPLQIDEFFEDNLDFTGGNKNLTEEYKAQTSDSDESAEGMVAYAGRQPVTLKLPTVKQDAIKVVNDDEIILASYMSTAGNIDALSNKAMLTHALSELINNNDAGTMQALARQIRLYQDNLVALKVPNQALPVHKVLLGYTELLAATIDQVALWPTDPVRAMAAIRQLEEIDRRYYPVIVTEMARLSQG